VHIVQWCRCRSAKVQMCSGSGTCRCIGVQGAGGEVQARCSVTEVQSCICSGAGAGLQGCNGGEVQRCRGAEVQRYRGTEVQRCIGVEV
jgi:hypothetical protein